MSETVLRDIVSWHRLYLAAKPFYVGVNVDRLAYPLHRSTACSRQMRGHSFMLDVVLSHHATVGSSAFPGDAKPSGLDI
jgi:hypothetical protein